MWFLKETNIPTNVLVKELNAFHQTDRPEENLKMLKDRPARTSDKIYKRKRDKLVKMMNEDMQDFQISHTDALFFPKTCNHIEDIYALCDRTIVWNNLYDVYGKMRECFSEIRNFGGSSCIHYKYKSTIGVFKSNSVQFRTCHAIKPPADKNLYYIKETVDKNGTVKTNIVPIKLSALIERMQLDEEFHVYNRTISYPYLKKNPINRTILNMWQQPDLVFYKQIYTPDIRKHAIWDHLTTVMAWNDPYKTEYIHTYVAMKIQEPHRKVEKILTLCNEVTGCGKTSFFHLLTALLGRNLTFELRKVEELTDKFNAHLHNILVVLCDDIHKLSRKQQQNLKTVCTEKNVKIERKGIDASKEEAFYDTICTTNFLDQLWVDAQDRRNEIVHVNPCKKQSKSTVNYWNEFYEGLKDLDRMKGFFDYFANYNIKLDIRSKTCRFDDKVLKQRVSDSLPLAHEYLINFFDRAQFFKNEIELEVFYNGHVWVSKGRLYDGFKRFVVEVGSQNKPTMKSFMTGLRNIGIDVERKRCSELFSGQKRRIELSPKILQNALNKQYGSVEVLYSGFKRVCHRVMKGITIDSVNKLFPNGDGWLVTSDHKWIKMSRIGIRANFARKNFMNRASDDNQSTPLQDE